MSTAVFPERVGLASDPGGAGDAGDLEAYLHLLRCPVCGAGLDHAEAGLQCGDEHRFDVVGGVPILLEPAERSALGIDFGNAAQMQAEYRGSLLAAVKRGAKKVIGSNLYLGKSATIRKVMAQLEGEWWLEVGSGTKQHPGKRINLDIRNFAGVDVVGSACNLPFADGLFAMVRSLAVLEHVREPAKMVAEICRVTRPGGYIYTEVPFIQHFHAYPNDFQRYTVEGLKQLFAGYEVVDVGVRIGPSSALTAMIGDWLELFTFSNRRWLNDLVRAVPLTLLCPLKFLDYVLVKNPRAHELASGISLLCRKPGSAKEVSEPVRRTSGTSSC